MPSRRHPVVVCHRSQRKMVVMDPDQPLRRHPGFTVEGTSLHHEIATAPGCAAVHSPYATRVFAAFATTNTLRQAGAELAAQLPTSAAWMEATECVRACYQAGLLIPVSAAAPPASPAGFAKESQHILMLNDATRTEAFCHALRAEVTPEDVVVDIGTGTGILAMVAAQSGAAKVYAVEQSAMADVAVAGFAANGLADAITLIRGRSTQITLPKKATLVVAEVIGDDLFDEGILEIFADAKSRLTTEGARFIPGSIRPVLVPLTLPDEVLAKHRYTDSTVAKWTQQYGIDFEWLLEADHRSPAIQFEHKVATVRTHVCGPAIDMPAVSLDSGLRWYQESVAWPGVANANALAVAFTSELAASITLSTDPTQEPLASSWGVPVWVPLRDDLSNPGHVTVRNTRSRTRLRFIPD